MRAIKGYAEATTYGDFRQLPRGGYICKVVNSKYDEKYDAVILAVDIAAGEYAGFYKDDYNAQSGENRKWHCQYWLNVPKGDGTQKDDWLLKKFKTFTTSLEESNEGYTFDPDYWDEQEFKGKLFGGLFNYREFETSAGINGMTANLAAVRSTETIKTGKYQLPKDKMLPTTGTGFISYTGTEPADNFSAAEDDIPF